MRRWLVDLLLAHVLGSFAVYVAMAVRFGPQPIALLLVAPAWAPAVMWDLTSRPRDFGQPLTTLLAIDGAYVLCFGLVIAASVRQQRRRARSRRRRQGLCTECGYDLTGNKSGRCPECGAHTVPKARLLLRRNA